MSKTEGGGTVGSTWREFDGGRDMSPESQPTGHLNP
jgi:hypothetical protein